MGNEDKEDATFETTNEDKTNWKPTKWKDPKISTDNTT